MMISKYPILLFRKSIFPTYYFSTIPDPLLRANASYVDILEAMKQPANGLGLLTTHQTLPPYTFISFDAINWLVNHMDGITTPEQAIKVLKITNIRLTFYLYTCRYSQRCTERNLYATLLEI